MIATSEFTQKLYQVHRYKCLDNLQIQKTVYKGDNLGILQTRLF